MESPTLHPMNFLPETINLTIICCMFQLRVIYTIFNLNVSKLTVNIIMINIWTFLSYTEIILVISQVCFNAQ